MTPDPLDKLSAQLFAAAREEAPPEGAEERAVLAIKRELSGQSRARVVPLFGSPVRRLLMVALLASVAIAVGVALTRDGEQQASIRPEKLLPEAPAPKVERAIGTTLESAPAPRPAVPAVRPVTGQVRPRAMPPSMQDELLALKEAQTALSSSDAPAALRALDRYDHVLKGKMLRAEASVLRIEALALGGQSDAASALATRFVEENPSSPSVDRVRTFIKSK